MSLYENINRRRKAGTSRSKSESTISEKMYQKMRQKKGGFKPKNKDEQATPITSTVLENVISSRR